MFQDFIYTEEEWDHKERKLYFLRSQTVWTIWNGNEFNLIDRKSNLPEEE